MTAADIIKIMRAAVKARCRIVIETQNTTIDLDPMDTESASPRTPAQSSSAERVRRFRERQAAALHPVTAPLHTVTSPLQPVTEALHPVTAPLHTVTSPLQPVTEALPPVTEALPPVTEALPPVTEALQPVTARYIPQTAPSPSPSLPTPLPSPPTSPQGKGVRVCAKEPEADWLESFEIPEPETPTPPPPPEPEPAPEPKHSKPKHQAEPEAVAQKLPGNPSQELVAAWEEWQTYRQAKARAKLSADRIPWTAQAARLAASQIMQHSARLGDRIVCDRIATAINGEWRGMNLDKLETPKPYAAHSRNSPPNRNGTHEPLPQAVDLNRNRLPPKLPRP